MTKDKITKKFDEFILENQGRGFAFKNYDIVDHLVFLRYNKDLIKRIYGILPKSNINT